ncbi:MAG TPA: FxsA family protein [Spirochaetia bacterium]|nr:FxsA family protein [Spirochaetia bacterium]
MASLLRLFEREFVVKFLLSFLLCSLLVLADSFVLFYLSRMYGVFLILAIEAGVSLAATFVVIDAVRHSLGKLRACVREGVYPRRQFREIAGCLLGGILMILPGFFTSAVGLLLFLPGMRYFAGYALTFRMGVQLNKVYEFLKMREFDGSGKIEADDET